MLIGTAFFRFRRPRGGAVRGAFLPPFGQGFFQRGFGLFQGNAGATTINFLAGKTFGGDFDISRQQYHIGLGDCLGAQRITRAHRALGFDLQVVTQARRRLLQGFGGHEGMGNARWACGDGNQARRTLGRHRGGLLHDIRGEQNLGLFGAAAQHRIDVLQGQGRGAAEQAFANEPRHVHRAAGNQQDPLGRFEGRRRQLAFRVGRVVDFDTGAPTLALRRSVQQAGAQHTGDHAVRAGRHNG
ncbi:hypothetical protein D3C76_1064610 [compost metagenome]